MTVIEKKLSFVTKGNTDIINLTPLVEQRLNESETSEGIITIFAPGATGGITTIEYEPGLINDLKEIMEKIIIDSPRVWDKPYYLYLPAQS